MFVAHVEYGALFMEMFHHVGPVVISVRVEAVLLENGLEIRQIAGESYKMCISRVKSGSLSSRNGHVKHCCGYVLSKYSIRTLYT